jgi:hypothetical protein
MDSMTLRHGMIQDRMVEAIVKQRKVKEELIKKQYS